LPVPCPVHRDPPSFPTRRSSDLATDRHGEALGPQPRTTTDAARLRRHERIELLAHGVRRRLLVATHHVREHAFPRLAVRARCARSEEHTSELQSRENLVCRLLLE